MTSRMAHKILAVALLLSFGCRQRQPAPPASSTAQAAQSGQRPAGASLNITDAKGGCVGTIVPGSPTRIVVGCGGNARIFVGKSHEAGKRKYYDDGRNLVFECKSDDGGMKLKGPDGRLRWKVSWEHEGKLKISDNEEGGRPIELRSKHNRIEVEDDGRPLGQVLFSAGQGEARLMLATGETGFVVRAGSSSPALGLMLAERIPLSERLALQAELLARGR
jgi:hypothetical protein